MKLFDEERAMLTAALMEATQRTWAVKPQSELTVAVSFSMPEDAERFVDRYTRWLAYLEKKRAERRAAAVTATEQ